MKTVITSAHHGLSPGDKIIVTMPDRRWWRRVWAWAWYQPPPMRNRRLRVAGAERDSFTTESLWARPLRIIAGVALFAWMMFVSLGGFVAGLISDPWFTAIWLYGGLTTIAVAFCAPGSIDRVLDGAFGSARQEGNPT